MEQILKDKLIELGIDVDDAMNRFMGNDKLLTKFLGKFKDSPTFEELKASIAAGDNEASLRNSHSLKGVCGNLSLTGLYQLFSQQVELYRAGKPEEANAMMVEIEAAYKKIVENI